MNAGTAILAFLEVEEVTRVEARTEITARFNNSRPLWLRETSSHRKGTVETDTTERPLLSLIGTSCTELLLSIWAALKEDDR